MKKTTISISEGTMKILESYRPQHPKGEQASWEDLIIHIHTLVVPNLRGKIE